MSRTSIFDGFTLAEAAANNTGYVPPRVEVPEKEPILFSGFCENASPIKPAKKFETTPNWRRMACAPSSKLGRRASKYPYANTRLRCG